MPQPSIHSFSATVPTTSARLQKALDAERQALERRHEGLSREARTLRERLGALEVEMQEIDERIVLLAELRGDADAALPAQDRGGEGTLLAGPAIRAAAVALLRDHAEGQGPIHYRRWLEIVERAGYEVGGRNPAATFLSQISRSPVVVRTTRPGHYQIDREAPARLRRRLAALRGELGAGALRDAGPVDLDEVRRMRAEASREVQQTERALAEATDAMTLPAAQLVRTG
jgi:hypothetical protein